MRTLHSEDVSIEAARLRNRALSVTLRCRHCLELIKLGGLVGSEKRGWYHLACAIAMLNEDPPPPEEEVDNRAWVVEYSYRVTEKKTCLTMDSLPTIEDAKNDVCEGRVNDFKILSIKEAK